MKIQAGQRWIWDVPAHQFIVEVMSVVSTTYDCRITQIIGESCTWHGRVGESCISFNLNDGKWQYLEGQDKPSI